MKMSIEVHLFFSLIFAWWNNMPDCKEASISKTALIFHLGSLAAKITFGYDEYRQVRLHNVELFIKRYLNFAVIGPFICETSLWNLLQWEWQKLKVGLILRHQKTIEAKNLTYTTTTHPFCLMFMCYCESHSMDSIRKITLHPIPISRIKLLGQIFSGNVSWIYVDYTY